ncbi:MAG: hypothetical protein ABJO54_03510 [Hyphomicrobiales bacterium]
MLPQKSYCADFGKAESYIAGDHWLFLQLFLQDLKDNLDPELFMALLDTAAGKFNVVFCWLGAESNDQSP